MASSSLFLRLLLLASSLCVGAAFAVGAPPVAAAPPALAQSLAQKACTSLHHPSLHRVAAPITMKQKKDVLELEGVVLESLPNANFRVQLDDTDQVILAHVSGKIRKNFIKILVRKFQDFGSKL